MHFSVLFQTLSVRCDEIQYRFMLHLLVMTQHKHSSNLMTLSIILQNMKTTTAQENRIKLSVSPEEALCCLMNCLK